MSSRLVPSLYPPLNQNNPAADAIYARRAASGRGLSPLDANLLNAPSAIVLGYNALLDGVRNEGRLVGYIREAIILRIAALNGAAYEWIHHVELGRKEGLSNGQLYVIRDTDTPLVLPSSKVVGALLTAVLRFTDESTRGAKVPMGVCERLKEEIGKSFLDGDGDGLYVEIGMVVGTYNMVSRFLLSMDVGGMSDRDVPWPVEREERFVSVPSFPPLKEPRHDLHCVTLKTSDSAPWLVFANGLNTDWRMWSFVIPRMLDRGFNMVLHSQRGHGLSTLPPPTEGKERLTSIELQAMDIAYILEELRIPVPVCGVIGVSQGGATTIGFAGMYGERTRSVVVCDTAGATPVGNKEAWEERMRVVCGSKRDDMEEYGEKVGMGKLGKMTVERWFPVGSSCHPGSEGVDGRVEWIEEMIRRTKVRGFCEGAKALGSYSVDGGTRVEKVLLVAGSLDGGGLVGKGMRRMASSWVGSEYVEIEGSGHLPMIDCPDVFCDRVLCFLNG